MEQVKHNVRYGLEGHEEPSAPAHTHNLGKQPGPDAKRTRRHFVGDEAKQK